MISERGLVAAMKDAWKNGAYNVIAYEENDVERLAVDGGFWLVDTPRIHFPRKALALIVEHAGEIPENAAYSLSKKGGLQALVHPITLQRVQSFYQLMRENPTMDVEKTKLTWQEREVWQKPEDMEVMLFEKLYLDIIDQKADDYFQEVYGDTLFFVGDRSMAAIMPVVNESDKLFLAHLSQMPWTGGKE